MYLCRHRGGSRTCGRRGRQPLKRGRQPNILYIFMKNLMKLKNFWSVGWGRAGSAPFRSATEPCETEELTWRVLAFPCYGYFQPISGWRGVEITLSGKGRYLMLGRWMCQNFRQQTKGERVFTLEEWWETAEDRDWPREMRDKAMKDYVDQQPVLKKDGKGGGKGGWKLLLLRQRRVLTKAIYGISKATFLRLACRGGVKRFSGNLYDTFTMKAEVFSILRLFSIWLH